MKSLLRCVALTCMGVGTVAANEQPRQPVSAAALPAAAVRSTEQGPPWSALKPAHRAALAPLRQDWSGIDAGRKQKWIEVAEQFPALSQAERDRIQERMAQWARMTPAERGRARLQFQESRQILPEERQALWEAYQALPQQERQALAARAASSAPPAKVQPARVEARPGSPVAKQNVVPSSGPATARTVAPTVVQAKPGVSTHLITRPAAPPPHHQPGLPKIAATRDFVDPATLLPMRGPQAAAVVGAAAAAAVVAPAAAPSPAAAASEPEDGSTS